MKTWIVLTIALILIGLVCVFAGWALGSGASYHPDDERHPQVIVP